MDIVLRVEGLLEAVEVRVALDTPDDDGVSDDVGLSEGPTDALFVTLPDSLAEAELVADSVGEADGSAEAVAEGEKVPELDDDIETNVGSEEGVSKFERTLPVADAEATVIVAIDVDETFPLREPEREAVFDGVFVCVFTADSEDRAESDAVPEFVALPVRDSVAKTDGEPFADCDAVKETLRDAAGDMLFVCEVLVVAL